MSQWFVLDVNPYPWKVPPMSAVRSGGKVFVKAGRDAGLHAYKEAIREQLESLEVEKIHGPVAVFLWYWRALDSHKGKSGRRVRQHNVDTTNMQKASEDALQGFLFENDVEVKFIQSTQVEQSAATTPKLVVCVQPWDGMAFAFPDYVQAQIDELDNRYPLIEKVLDSAEDIPF